jgi:hypothetical protein
MLNSYSTRVWRCATVWSAAVFAALFYCGVGLYAGELTDTEDFAEVGATAERYAQKFKPEQVLLVLDIDNTLLAMDSPLGSDQWFEWQKYLIEHEPSSKYVVADSFKGLIDAQGLLYDISHMHPPQPNLPALMRHAQDAGIHTLVLTSRGPEFRAATEREFKRNGYDFARTAMPVHDVPGGTFVPYDVEKPESAGLTKEELAKFHLKEPKPISYENGILMTSGQNKGAMLLVLLHDAKDDVEAVVYDDDNIRHVSNVYAAVRDRGKEISAFHYTKEDANVKKFDYGSKKEVNRKWRQLTRTLEEVLN